MASWVRLRAQRSPREGFSHKLSLSSLPRASGTSVLGFSTAAESRTAFESPRTLILMKSHYILEDKYSVI